MRRKTLVVVPVIALLCAVGAIAQSVGQVSAPQATSVISAEMNPTAPWRRVRADAECRMVREFSNQDQRLAFRIDQVSPRFFHLAIIGSALDGFRDRSTVTIHLDQQGTEIQRSGQAISVQGQDLVVLRLTGIDAAFIGQLHADQRVVISNARTTIRFRLDNADRALTVLQSCYDDLIRSTRASAPQPSALRSPAAPIDAASWVTARDHPAEDLRAGRGGLVSTLLTVNTQGRVSNCLITESSGSWTLDATACALFTQRGRFRPAIGVDGQPTTDVKPRRVQWNLPN